MTPVHRFTAPRPTSALPTVPRTRQEGQTILRRFGIRGLKIDSIEEPILTVDGAAARIYALTGEVLQPDGQMRRLARTIVLRFTDEEVRAEQLEGWIVADTKSLVNGVT